MNTDLKHFRCSIEIGKKLYGDTISMSSLPAIDWEDTEEVSIVIREFMEVVSQQVVHSVSKIITGKTEVDLLVESSDKEYKEMGVKHG